MKNTFLNDNDIDNYTLILTEFYENISKNRKIACYQLCEILSKINQNKKLFELIKNKEFQSYISSRDRTNYLKVSFIVFIVNALMK